MKRRLAKQRPSVRRAVAAALSILAFIAVVQLFVELRAFSSAAFLLQRAAISYRQLEAYQRLSIALLDDMRAKRGRSPRSADEQGRIVREGLANLEQLSSLEIELIHDHGASEIRSSEDKRLSRIAGATRRLLLADSDPAETIYDSDIGANLGDAIRGEDEEVLHAHEEMSALQTRLSVAGPLGVLLQVATAGLVVLLVGRLVLAPVNRLVVDIRLLGRGALAHRVAVKRHDELGLLALHINRMAASLERGRRALVTANDRLEGIVLDRTRALSERNAELKQIDESRRRFFADVSHELRTPLTAIIGEADVTLRIAGDTVPPYRSALASILANSTFLNRRIDDLMALARSNDGIPALDLRTVDLDLVAAEAVAEIGSLARINDVRLRLVSRETPPAIRGDRARLRQVVMILLDNAVKFSREGQEVVLVVGRDGEQASLCVVDSGRGIAAADLPKVFERFYQAEHGKRLGGTGLGLAIARRIVEAHGGTIDAASGETGGTCVTLRLPADEEERT